MRNLVERYVVAYSMLWSRGTYLANLCAISHMSGHAIVGGIFPPQTITLPSFITGYKDLKTCFLPERWTLKNLHALIPPLVLQTYEANRDVLDPLLPDYEFMVDTGWDNALNHMGCSYLGNIKVQVLTPLFGRLQKYIKDHHPIHKATNRARFCFMAFGAVTQMYERELVHVDDQKWLLTVFRPSFGVAEDAWFNKNNAVFENLDNTSWSLHV